MEKFLPPGEKYILNALKFSLSSPFTFDGQQTPEQITNIYRDASDFAIHLITVGNTPTEKASADAESNFKKILIDNLGDDEQDKLIVLDYLIIDYVVANHDLGSSEIKSAISANDLVDHPEVKLQF